MITRGRLRIALGALALVSCRDGAKEFSTREGRYEGSVVTGGFVRAGIAEDVRMCVTIDGERMQDTPGTLSTSDGRFKATPMRPIPQIWHDPLSTLTFGDGRTMNFVYAAAPDLEGPDGEDVTVFVSLMESGSVEVRLLRGAPGAARPDRGSPLFAIFELSKEKGPCSF